eukprot:TRINITY_DN13786_c0_g1_i5.p1 TRINITY_DN13786_c0_g1~~TRINITY_DN13786_c0_g1_i5.p1  ORF type:complete len:114 (-),score=3.66 TRINITY_DN13786_c0_g1_i5:2693-3034(-)
MFRSNTLFLICFHNSRLTFLGQKLSCQVDVCRRHSYILMQPYRQGNGQAHGSNGSANGFIGHKGPRGHCPNKDHHQNKVAQGKAHKNPTPSPGPFWISVFVLIPIIYKIHIQI